MKKLFLILLIVSSAVLLFSSCGHERVGCNGKIIVVNEIPDTTLYVGGDPLIRDVSGSPIVFRHTEKEPINIQILSSDVGENGFVVETERRESNITDRLHVIVIKPNSTGRALVEVTATDDCEGNEVITAFNVTVIDTTQ